jgi:hypothetical protein
MREQETVATLFSDLLRAPLRRFEPLDTPDCRGVYVIYGPGSGDFLHVGSTPRGQRGLRQRMRNRVTGTKSSFAREYLN